LIQASEELSERRKAAEIDTCGGASIRIAEPGRAPPSVRSSTRFGL
uniref:DUF305 domain-containing protein n=1 Tax=Ascaris lumbricoides TaxID=6252 RepID=A0A0M3HMC9_ASCLU